MTNERLDAPAALRASLSLLLRPNGWGQGQQWQKAEAEGLWIAGCLIGEGSCFCPLGVLRCLRNQQIITEPVRQQMEDALAATVEEAFPILQGVQFLLEPVAANRIQCANDQPTTTQADMKRWFWLAGRRLEPPQKPPRGFWQDVWHDWLRWRRRRGERP